MTPWNECAACRIAVNARFTTTYLADTAQQAGHDVELLTMQSIGWDDRARRFVDERGRAIQQLFKLYPTEWMIRESFGPKLLGRSMQLIEAPWKLLLSSKAILPLLWEFNPGHPNLLPAFYGPAPRVGAWAVKPISSREGANVVLVDGGRPIEESGGKYGSQPVIHQGLTDLHSSSGMTAVIGSWVVGDLSAGIGIREDASKITRNLAHFVPHYFED